LKIIIGFLSFDSYYNMNGQIETGKIMETNKHYHLCIKAITGEIAPDEKTELDRWLKQSRKNQNLYDEIEAAWQQTELHDLPVSFDLAQEWTQLQQRLQLESEPIMKKRSRYRFGEFLDKYVGVFRPGLRPAFVLCVTLLIFITIFHIFRDQSEKSEYLEIFTAYKQQIEFVFSDGSKVRLNSGSSIKFLDIFSDTLREVYLSGEAFFEVTPAHRPFVVITDNAETKVLGTQFNVWSRGTQTRVIVKSGKVQFSSLSNQNQTVELVKDQMSWIVNCSSPEIPQQVDAEYLLGWLDGRFVFEKAPLKELIAELQRSYDVTIELEDIELENHTITANFDNSSLETMLESICLTLGIKHKIELNKIVLSKNH